MGKNPGSCQDAGQGWILCQDQRLFFAARLQPRSYELPPLQQCAFEVLAQALAQVLDCCFSGKRESVTTCRQCPFCSHEQLLFLNPSVVAAPVLEIVFCVLMSHICHLVILLKVFRI